MIYLLIITFLITIWILVANSKNILEFLYFRKFNNLNEDPQFRHIIELCSHSDVIHYSALSSYNMKIIFNNYISINISKNGWQNDNKQYEYIDVNITQGVNGQTIYSRTLHHSNKEVIYSIFQEKIKQYMSNVLIDNEIKYSDFKQKVEEINLIKKDLIDILFLHPIYEKAFKEDKRREELDRRGISYGYMSNC